MFDLIILTDPRFQGGTTASVMTDLAAFSAAGLSVGVYLVRSQGFFRPEDRPHPGLEQIADLEGVTLCQDGSELAAAVALFHHPMIFHHPVLNPAPVRAERSFIVTHAPLFDGHGAMSFDPFRVASHLRTQFGVRPVWAPISGLCRTQYRSLAPFLPLSAENWPNSFDIRDWRPSRPKMSGPVLTIGRHSRPHAEKWPDHGPDISASLPSSDTVRVRVMGADRPHLRERGVDIAGWDIIPFGGETPVAFLDSLDVFSYFHSASYIEAYGRTVAEAMLMTCRCLLPESLRPTFGPHALYGRPADVPAMLDHIRTHKEAHQAASARARAHIEAEVSTRTIIARFQRLRQADPTLTRRGGVAVAPLTALRKLIGVRRRSHRRRAETP